MWGDKLPIKHKRAIVIASLGLQPVCIVYVRFFVALNRSTGILYCLCNLDIYYTGDTFVNEMPVPKQYCISEYAVIWIFLKRKSLLNLLSQQTEVAST